MLRSVPVLAFLLATMILPAASAGGSQDTQTECVGDVVHLVCATGTATLDVSCGIAGDTATCYWNGTFEGTFGSEAGLPGQGQVPAWASIDVCGSDICMGIIIDFYVSCTWQATIPCTVAGGVIDSSSWVLEPGACLDAEATLGVPAHAAVPTFAVHVVEAEVLAIAEDSASVCRGA